MLLIRQVECCNLQAASIPNSTGIGFFDHMLDQFHSHAQVGVGIHVTILNGEEATHVDATTPLESLEGMIQHHNRFAVMNTTTTSQEELMRLVGRALGAALRPLLQQVPSGQASRFCCPLDEALVECILQTLPPKDDNNAITSSSSSIFVYDLAPYGSYPSTGRSHIGYMETQPLQPFWQELFISSGLYQFQLRKVRGDNAHHIVESSFKAVARALRNLLDQCHTTMDITSPNSIMMTIMWDDMDSDNYKASAALDRQAKSERKTKETTIAVQVHLTPRDHLLPPNVQTGIDVLDQFLSHLACHAQMNLTCTCQGDVWVDEHHTSEDVAITLGQVLYEALGTKAGLNRMWCAQGTCGDAVVEVTMDLSNRPCLRHNLTLSDDEYVVDPRHRALHHASLSPRLTVEMFEHVLDSLVVNARMTVHVVERNQGASMWERAMATAMAFGTALRYCAMVDCRRAGQTASSKGTLSV